MSVLVAIAVNEDGYHEVLGAAEGMKEGEYFRSFAARTSIYFHTL